MEELKFDEIKDVNGGVDWNGVGSAFAMGGGSLYGTVQGARIGARVGWIGGPAGGAIGAVVGGTGTMFGTTVVGAFSGKLSGNALYKSYVAGAAFCGGASMYLPTF